MSTTNYISASSKIRSFLFGCALLINQVSAITVDVTDAEGAIGFLFPSDSSVIVSNINFVGDERCFGIFGAGLSAVPDLDPAFPDEGIVLGTGNVEDLPLQDSGSQSTAFGTPGDQDLFNLLPPGSPATLDACVIEVDFKCNYCQEYDVSFNYVFGSDEYLEYAGSAFNDVFALFLNGQNLAIVPGTTDAVAINSVNQFTNTEYFVANEGLLTYPGIEMDGFTQTFSTAIGTASSGTNTLKIAIADVSDAVWDSWVLLEAGSFTCTKEPDDDYRERAKANAIERAGDLPGAPDNWPDAIELYKGLRGDRTRAPCPEDEE